MKALYRFIATGFLSGYIPVAPGTAGSIAGLGVYWLAHADSAFQLIALAILFTAGMKSISELEAEFRGDDRRIVVDEVCGVMVALLFLPYSFFYIASAFVFFRVFDILKPFPIRVLEKLRSPWGIMLDDIAAGIYANIAVRVIAGFIR
ncbi:MAG: hypothetical protein AUJ75_02200 [Candidatus Omnitrophica bacterium CG1_02_49_10]|nr:MAG: hypothetical protein AUJ75_02200 [Candidatus Omnitrophica bacterium CG1_02_49_10]